MALVTLNQAEAAWKAALARRNRRLTRRARFQVAHILNIRTWDHVPTTFGQIGV